MPRPPPPCRHVLPSPPTLRLLRPSTGSANLQHQTHRTQEQHDLEHHELLAWASEDEAAFSSEVGEVQQSDDEIDAIGLEEEGRESIATMSRKGQVSVKTQSHWTFQSYWTLNLSSQARGAPTRREGQEGETP